MHIHIGGHPEPSVNDIIQLANVNAITNSGYTTEFVVNENGEKYAIVIIDAGKAVNFYNAYKNSYAAPGVWYTDTKIGRKFYDIKNLLMLRDHQSELNAHMLAQAYILKEFKSGISLLQQQPDGTFHEVHQQVIKHRNSDPTFITTICP